MRSRIVIADKHAGFRHDLRLYLTMLEEGYQVVGEADTAADALAQVAVLQPDIVLLDIELPDSSGLLATRTIWQRWPATAVIIISNSPDAEYRQAALDAHAVAYIDKKDVIQSLPQVLATVSQRPQAPPPQLHPDADTFEGPILLRRRLRVAGSVGAVLAPPALAEIAIAHVQALVAQSLQHLAASRQALARRLATRTASRNARRRVLTGWQWVHAALAVVSFQVIFALQSLAQRAEPGDQSSLAIIFVAFLGIAVLEVRQLSRALAAAAASRGGRDGI